MFRSVKLKNGKRTIFFAICALLFAAAAFFALRSGAADTVTVGEKTISLRAQDAADTAAFLTACGCDGALLLSEKEVTVPKHWNKTYDDYNALQRQQGLDLVPYKGKPAQEVVFCVDGGRYATLLISGGRIIAAHRCESDGSGMQPLLDGGS